MTKRAIHSCTGKCVEANHKDALHRHNTQRESSAPHPNILTADSHKHTRTTKSTSGSGYTCYITIVVTTFTILPLN